MADNQLKGMLSGASNKQKAMAVVTVVVIMVVIWQIIGLFRGEGGDTPAPAEAPKQMSASNAGGSTPANPNPMQPNVVNVAGGTGTETLTPVSPLTMPKNTDLLKEQMDQQKNYLDSVNRLQLLKLQREIAETNQAISAAKLATATADKSMSDLLTQPAPVVPQAAYANKLADSTGAAPPGGPTAEQTQTIPPPPLKVIAPQYQVISVSMQFQRWSAVVGLQGKLFSVSVGDNLPDGSIVTSISKEGVVMEKDGKKKKISVTTAI